MAVPTTQTSSAQAESKSAQKKKKAKSTSESASASAAESSAFPPDAAPSQDVHETSNGEAYESPYIKELYKNIRNVNKKITNASKVDNVIAENPGMSLDELVAARKINADQKAQILKKPSLQATLQQYEEQIAMYKKFDQEYKARAQAEKAEVERSLTKRLMQEKEEAVQAAADTASVIFANDQRVSLLHVSRFLRLAAQRRADETANPNQDENMALEAVLYLFYDGEDRAVQSMLKYIQGSTEKVMAIDGTVLQTTYAQIKAAAGDYEPATAVAQDLDHAYPTPPDSADYPVQSDPTIANAGLTELNDGPLTNGHTQDATASTGVVQSGVGGGNAVAEANWDNGNDVSPIEHEWVQVVSRDASETDTGVTATFAAPTQTQSWADDEPPAYAYNTPTAPAPITHNGGDGFEQVSRNRGSREGGLPGGWRPRGGRGGDYRGRGRGEYRGRGRGGRGRGGDRGRGSRQDES